MATIAEQLVALATRVGQENKTLHGITGVLADLTTTDKVSLVAAVNEVKAQADALNASLSAVSTKADANEADITAIEGQITSLQSSLDALEGMVASQTNIDDDNVSAATTYSSSKITSEITAARQAVKDELLNGAGEAYDTLKELGELIKTNQDAIASLETLAAGHVKYDGAQELTNEQKTQARTNIGAASADDVSALSTAVASNTTLAQKGVDDASAAASDAAAAQTAAEAAQADVDALAEAVGDTSVDPVAAFEAALNG